MTGTHISQRHYGGLDWILWSGTVGFDRPIDERVAAAIAAGYDTLSITTVDVANAEREGMTAAQFGRHIRAQGLDLIMDPVMNWCEGSEPSPSRFARFTLDEALRMCEEVQVASLSVIGPTMSAATPEAVTASFETLCDRAAQFGARVHLEFIPFTTIPDLATAWTIVSGAGRDNGGLVFDAWHFFRGNPDFGLLERIPGDRIFVVQIDDAAEDLQGTLREDTTRRLLPGDGCFDLVRAMDTLHRVGALRAVGPEVISPVLESMPALEAAQVAADRVRQLVDAVAG